MHSVQIKPLSVNRAWQGKRFKTPEYKRYERDVLLMLPALSIPDGDLSIALEFGVSNIASDWDNPVKPFVDILQKKYGFNDSRIYQGSVEKVKVKKGQEYVKFEIRALPDNWQKEAAA